MSGVARKLLGAAAVILDDAQRILLVHHTYGKFNWELPGGYSESNESPTETALREVHEETGLVVAATRLTGVYYEPERPGIGPEMVHFVFHCDIVDADQFSSTTSPEIGDCRFFPRDKLPRPISDFTLRRMDDAFSGGNPMPLTIPSRSWLT
ncbi:MAG: NUDIX domain-containing protein [Chloroflexota bacterium]